ncbi:MAG: AhpC/TSA family protein [Paramuribaculum sp.]|nr:AhpC/TSA family protein [Paramuribaculum sp.]
MKNKFLLGSLFLALTASCATAQKSGNYSLTVNLSPDEDGMFVCLTDFDSGNKIDSALVADGVAKFNGNVDAPYYARLIIDGNRIGDLIIEPTQIEWTPESRTLKSEGQLQGKMQEMSAKLGDLTKQFRSLPDDSTSEATRKAIIDRYNTIVDSTMVANIDNPIGYMLFLDKASQMELGELDALLAKYPKMQSSVRVQRSRQHLLVKQETSVGKKYKDFAITNDGVTQRLSDYVGPDHYTLVDFWASWCGPCIRETKVIKELYDKYNGKGLEFLGVAVWDEPQNTRKAIEQHQLPWNMIINAQTIPTDLYGISGIPCIILIAPDGTIVSRDKQDADLVADVEAAMASFSAPAKSESTTETTDKND